MKKRNLFILVITQIISLIFAFPLYAGTLADVRERGYLICATTESLSGFSNQSDDGLWSGFDVDLCRAISAAIFLDPNKVEFRELKGDARFASLQTGEVDVMTRNAPWTMSRDISYSVHYVATSFFDGQSFLVKQELGVVSVYELENISVCVLRGGEDQKNIEEFFFENQIEYREILYEDRADLRVAFEARLCDAISAPASYLYSMLRNSEQPSKYSILPERISKRPLGIVVRDNDDEWFNIVRWVLFILINAEELGVNSASVESLKDTKTPAIRRLLGYEGNFGKGLGLDEEWARAIISSVGNYGEIYERNFGPQYGVLLPRGPNALWRQGGLLFAPPVR